MNSEDRQVTEDNTARSDKLYKFCQRFRKRRRGASAVEFAIVAPIFFMLLLGMVEFGRMIMVQQILTNGTREGARTAVLDKKTNTDVINATENYLNTGRVTGSSRRVEIGTRANNGTITPITLGGNNPPAAGTPITVQVTINFSDVSWLPSPFFLGGKVMTASSTMRKETSN